jgi:hypothetical protein
LIPVLKLVPGPAGNANEKRSTDQEQLKIMPVTEAG